MSDTSSIGTAMAKTTEEEYEAIARRVISTITNSIVGNITVGTRPFDIVYNPINHNMYVANQGSNTVSVIDSARNLVIRTIPAGSQTLML